MRNDATQQFSPTQLGKSLVTGYEHLGIELARPQFRSKMEQDMKDIALGRQNKHQVISTCLHFVLQILCMCPHTAICVRILLCVCPHAAKTSGRLNLDGYYDPCPQDMCREEQADNWSNGTLLPGSNPQLVLVLRSCTVKRL